MNNTIQTATLSSRIQEANEHLARAEQNMLDMERLWEEICALCDEDPKQPITIYCPEDRAIYATQNGQGWTVYNRGFAQSTHADRAQAEMKMNTMAHREKRF